jgi:hypothetical protein
MPHAGSSCAHARSPASTYCRAKSSQYARFLATCSSSSLIANPRSVNPDQYNQELTCHFANYLAYFVVSNLGARFEVHLEHYSVTIAPKPRRTSCSGASSFLRALLTSCPAAEGCKDSAFAESLLRSSAPPTLAKGAPSPSSLSRLLLLPTNHSNDCDNSASGRKSGRLSYLRLSASDAHCRWALLASIP